MQGESNLRFMRKLGKKRTFSERRALCVIALALVLPFIGVAGYRALERRQPASSLPVADAAPIPSLPATPAFVEFSDTFRKNETITDALTRHSLTNLQVLELVQATRPLYSLRKVIAGREFAGNLTSNGEFHEFRYRIDDEKYLTVYRDGDRFVPLLKKFNYETRTESFAGVIEDSLYLAVTDAGEQALLAGELADIFTWDVDFYTDIQKGDSFRVLLEKQYLNGKFARYGKILAADLVVQNKVFSAFRFQNEYYDSRGNALRKTFLKSPLKFARISSRFSSARFHPILKIVRPHLGVDYAAPTGTVVVAVASGTVALAGLDGNLGRSVRLRHADGYESVYSHLSSIAVRSGSSVAQGEVIGQVGATGLATGPHLDFRLLRGGKYLNPTKVILPPAQPVAAALFASFAALRDDLRSRLDQMPRGNGNPAQAAQTRSTGGGTWK
jgi:murein DD-endopeptidase MepM/ murein hydrolase activator NlpD